MRAQLLAPVLALSFLTVLPLRATGAPLTAFPRALAYFPAVGLVVGVLVALVDAGASLVFPVGVVAAVDLAAIAILTGGLHLDGLADSIDGLLVWGDRERRLAVMREGTIGAFAAAGVAIVLLAEYGALTALAAREREVAIALGAVLARWCMVLVVWRFPYVREAGAGAAFKCGPLWPELLAATAFAGLAAVSASVPQGWVAALAAGASAIGIGRWAEAKLGGLTGDVYGACGELAFAVTLLAWVAGRP